MPKNLARNIKVEGVRAHDCTLKKAFGSLLTTVLGVNVSIDQGRAV